ncbi:dihydrofolate reductase family protein [Histidinibacterium aquaticum]|uniref:Dihydrofolate reductase n=1 Tax=Histidinibacterium aquaticum TaxID=2613962 RepID=A0A5J5GL67_9RHOB|nr:dihydrofolate reductase family protein [Histidinibacterium aquaticum]KAA9008955.1 dihydrofolate reductase [Histidinibacterium aquaticum]
MATLVYGMNLSLDGYVDHEAFAPDPVLFRHWIDYTESLAGSLYGRKLYEIMRYWEDDQPDWGPDERDFAAAWRKQPKWVVSRGAVALGPNATQLDGDLATAVHGLKAQVEGEIDAGGPDLARSLIELGLVDEYRLYYHPVVLGTGTPFFAGSVPRLRPVGSDRIGEDVLRLTYVPA